MKKTTLILTMGLVAAGVGLYAQGPHHGHRGGSDGVVLATQIVDLVNSVIRPPVVIQSAPVVYQPAPAVVYQSAPVVYPPAPVVVQPSVVYPVPAPIYYAPPVRYRSCRPLPPPPPPRHPGRYEYRGRR